MLELSVRRRENLEDLLWLRRGPVVIQERGKASVQRVKWRSEKWRTNLESTSHLGEVSLSNPKVDESVVESHVDFEMIPVTKKR